MYIYEYVQICIQRCIQHPYKIIDKLNEIILRQLWSQPGCQGTIRASRSVCFNIVNVFVCFVYMLRLLQKQAPYKYIEQTKQNILRATENTRTYKSISRNKTDSGATVAPWQPDWPDSCLRINLLQLCQCVCMVFQLLVALRINFISMFNVFVWFLLLEQSQHVKNIQKPV